MPGEFVCAQGLLKSWCFKCSMLVTVVNDNIKQFSDIDWQLLVIDSNWQFWCFQYLMFSDHYNSWKIENIKMWLWKLTFAPVLRFKIS